MSEAIHKVPGWEGSVGPFANQYGQPHVYARDVHSGAGNCVCGRALPAALHVQAAPGVPVTPEQAMAALTEITANLDGYIERRANEIAEPRIAQAETAANERVAEVERLAAHEKRRHDALRDELSKRLDVAWQHVERLKGADGG